MTRYIERIGTYRARAVEWKVRTISTGATVVEVMFEASHLYEPEVDAWKVIGSGVVRGGFFPLKDTGAPNEDVVEMLAMHLGWQGTFAEVQGVPPQDGPLQIDVGCKDGKGKQAGKKFYNATWIRGIDDDPTAGRPDGGALRPEKVAELDKQYGKDLGDLARKVRASQAEPTPSTPVGAHPKDAGQDYGDLPF